MTQELHYTQYSTHHNYMTQHISKHSNYKSTVMIIKDES